MALVLVPYVVDVVDETGNYRLCGYYTNRAQTGMAFDGLYQGALISGGRYRIAMTGVPGAERATVDRFYLLPPYQHNQNLHHGSNLMNLLVRTYTAAGTLQLLVNNPTPVGRRFYLRNGFARTDVGDYLKQL